MKKKHLAAGVCFALTALAASPTQDEDQIESTREALREMVANRRIISEERRDWKLGRELLHDRIEVVKTEIDSFRTRIAEAESSIGEADQKLGELVAENEGLKEASRSLMDTVTAFEEHTKELLKRLPPQILERVRPLSQKLPEDPEETKLSLSERYLSIVGICNAVNRFHREITVSSETLTLSDGSTALVTTVYLGISQGYYVSAKADAAGIGTATQEGWSWRPADEAATDIAVAVAILANDQPAAFVRLPVTIE